MGMVTQCPHPQKGQLSIYWQGKRGSTRVWGWDRTYVQFLAIPVGSFTCSRYGPPAIWDTPFIVASKPLSGPCDWVGVVVGGGGAGRNYICQLSHCFADGVSSWKTSRYSTDTIFYIDRYCKTRKFHLRLIFATFADEAKPWKLKDSKCFTLVMI